MVILVFIYLFLLLNVIGNRAVNTNLNYNFKLDNVKIKINYTSVDVLNNGIKFIFTRKHSTDKVLPTVAIIDTASDPSPHRGGHRDRNNYEHSNYGHHSHHRPYENHGYNEQYGHHGQDGHYGQHGYYGQYGSHLHGGQNHPHGNYGHHGHHGHHAQNVNHQIHSAHLPHSSHHSNHFHGSAPHGHQHSTYYPEQFHQQQDYGFNLPQHSNNSSNTSNSSHQQSSLVAPVQHPVKHEFEYYNNEATHLINGSIYGTISISPVNTLVKNDTNSVDQQYNDYDDGNYDNYDENDNMTGNNNEHYYDYQTENNEKLNHTLSDDIVDHDQPFSISQMLNSPESLVSQIMENKPDTDHSTILSDSIVDNLKPINIIENPQNEDEHETTTVINYDDTGEYITMINDYEYITMDDYVDDTDSQPNVPLDNNEDGYLFDIINNLKNDSNYNSDVIEVKLKPIIVAESPEGNLGDNTEADIFISTMKNDVLVHPTIDSMSGSITLNNKPSLIDDEIDELHEDSAILDQNNEIDDCLGCAERRNRPGTVFSFPKEKTENKEVCCSARW